MISLLVAPSAVGVNLEDRRVVARADRPAPASPLIAPPAACAGQNSLEASAQTQEQAMHCMTDFARRRAGLTSLAEANTLNASARRKSRDILRCDSFSHSACGREFTYWMQETGYIAGPCWRAGENLAWGAGDHGTVRAIFRAWMRSPHHRQVILGDYSQLGIGLLTGNLAGRAQTHVWTQHLGSQCDAPPAQA